MSNVKFILAVGSALTLNAGAASLSQQYNAARESERAVAEARERIANEPYRKQAATAGLQALAEKMRSALVKKGAKITAAELIRGSGVTESGIEISYRAVDHSQYADAQSQYLEVTYKAEGQICRASGRVQTPLTPPSGVRAFTGDAPDIEVQHDGCVTP